MSLAARLAALADALEADCPVLPQSRVLTRRPLNHSTHKTAEKKPVNRSDKPTAVPLPEPEAQQQQQDESTSFLSDVLNNPPWVEEDGVFTARFYRSIDPNLFEKLKSTCWEFEAIPTDPTAPEKLMPALPEGGGINGDQHNRRLMLWGKESNPQWRATPCDPTERKVPESELPLECIPLNVIYYGGKTGFEESKEYTIEVGELIAGRYRIEELLGEAAFSRAMRCTDLHQPIPEEERYSEEEEFVSVCVKVINTGKEFFDQALDEIKILQLLAREGEPEELHVVRMYDYFYWKEHIFIVCELLSDNLYQYAKSNRESLESPTDFYFTVPRLRSIARQILTALEYVHSVGLLHCDLKPENVMFRSHSRCEVTVIDFGSSAYLTDRLSGYIQSRSYRAPEVILAADYDGRIDIWSLGAILVELVTGDVLFHSETVSEMLARIVSVIGSPLPEALLKKGRHTNQCLNAFGTFFEIAPTEDGDDECFTCYFPTPKPSAAVGRLEEILEKGSPIELSPSFLRFVRRCLTLDYTKRPTATELLQDPFIVDGDDA